MIEDNIFYKPFRTTGGAVPFDRITTADYEPAILRGIEEHDAEVCLDGSEQPHGIDTEHPFQQHHAQRAVMAACEACP